MDLTECGGTPLTREMMEELFARARERMFEVPESSTHFVHPQSRGWAVCAMCFSPLWIVEGEDGKLYAGMPPEEELRGVEVPAKELERLAQENREKYGKVSQETDSR